MKRLWLVKDRPQHSGESSKHCFVVRAKDEATAIRIVNGRLKKTDDDCWDVETITNLKVWE